MEEHFDVVVVGSGFGASAAACRLAQAGRSVLVLERGRSYPPGSFPRSPRGLAANLWAPSSGLYGMFDVWAFQRHRVRGDRAALAAARSSTPTSCSARTRPGSSTTRPTSAPRPWPVTYADLEPHYEAAEAMIGVQRYPFDVAPYSATRQDPGDLRDAAKRSAWTGSCRRSRSASPAPASPRSPGSRSPRSTPTCTASPRRTCRLCGECDVGCNDGAKNTLDYTYLSRAARRRGRDPHPVRGPPDRAGTPHGGYRIGYLTGTTTPSATEPPGSRPGASHGHRPTGWSSAPARSVRPSCCSATGRPSPASARPSAPGSPATATC